MGPCLPSSPTARTNSRFRLLDVVHVETRPPPLSVGSRMEPRRAGRPVHGGTVRQGAEVDRQGHGQTEIRRRQTPRVSRIRAGRRRDRARGHAGLGTADPPTSPAIEGPRRLEHPPLIAGGSPRGLPRLRCRCALHAGRHHLCRGRLHRGHDLVRPFSPVGTLHGTPAHPPGGQTRSPGRRHPPRTALPAAVQRPPRCPDPAHPV